MLTISLLCCRFWRYFFIVGDSGNDVKSNDPFNNPWEKDVKLSVPTNERSGSIFSGVSCAWLRWCEFLSAITCSTISGLSTVLNSKLGFFISFHVTVSTTGMSIVCNDDFCYLQLNSLFCTTLLLPIRSFVCWLLLMNLLIYLQFSLQKLAALGVVFSTLWRLFYSFEVGIGLDLDSIWYWLRLSIQC